MSFYSNDELKAMGFGFLGKDVRLSRKASFYNVANIEIGDFSRIDDFCVLSAGDGGISIGRHVHVAVYTSLIGASHIMLSDYCNLSSRVSIYSSSDDYSGSFMTNPTVPEQYTDVRHADVFLGKYVIIGCGSVILPGIVLEEGVAVGALSLISKSCKAFGIYAGGPAKRIKERKRDFLKLAQSFEVHRCDD